MENGDDAKDEAFLLRRPALAHMALVPAEGNSAHLKKNLANTGIIVARTAGVIYPCTAFPPTRRLESGELAFNSRLAANGTIGFLTHFRSLSAG